jgi:hypothetical protein
VKAWTDQGARQILSSLRASLASMVQLQTCLQSPEGVEGVQLCSPEG